MTDEQFFTTLMIVAIAVNSLFWAPVCIVIFKLKRMKRKIMKEHNLTNDEFNKLLRQASNQGN